jgi:tripartite-type tricarboxylate transporter receptor subunit TctC
MKKMILAMVLLLVGWAFGAGTSPALAQSYPDRPIQLVIPGAAGSILDIAGRVMGDELGRILKAQLIPVVKPGAGFTLGTDFVARSKKDGYTLTYTNSAAIVFTRLLNPETVPYDPDKDLDALGLHVFFPNAIAVQGNAPWKNFGELLDYAKKNPNKIRVSTTGIGSTSHFNLQIIESLSGAQFNHVPFKGGESVITALLGGHVDMTFDAVSKIKPHVETGKMKILLVTSKVPDLPQVPTLTELGFKQDMFTSWFGMYGPAGLPDDVKKILIPAVEKAVKNPDLKAKVEKMDFVVAYKSPAEQKRMAIEEYEKGLAIAIKAGLRNK